MHLMIVGIIMVQRILWKGGLDMKFGPIEIKDKSNRTIVLRNATPEDAEDLITYLKVTTAETPYLIREPEEVIMTQEQETAFINNCLNSDRSLMLIATLDGNISETVLSIRLETIRDIGTDAKWQLLCIRNSADMVLEKSCWKRC